MSDIFADALHRLSRVSGVRGALIVEAASGLPVQAELSGDVEESAIAALASSLFRRTSNAASAARFGKLHTMQLEADGGHVVVAESGELLVVAVAAKNAQLGLVRFEAHRAAESLL
jgi:predicted regulator of Ras-like GTPase activity (Roadblock/LC7/MglB family)